MDVYVDKRERVWLLDVNVFAPVTDALLFSWDGGAEADNNPLLNEGLGDQHQQLEQQRLEEDNAGEATAVVVVEEPEEEGETSTFRVSTSPLASSASSFLFRIVGGGGGGSSSASGGMEGGIAVAPDPLSMYRAPMDLVALGGQLDMEELMRVTMAQRQQQRGGSGSSSDSSNSSDDEGQEAE
jgi:hypothetical protein